MGPIETLLAGIARCPEDDTGWLALADCLDEHGEGDRAELVRAQLSLRRQLDDPRWPEWQRRQEALWRAGVKPCLPVMPGPHGLEFILVPPGSFWMGAPADELWTDDDERPRRRVVLPRGLYVGRCPVTQRQYKAVMGHNPSHMQGLKGEQPVECVSFGDCLALCGRLGRTMGRSCRLPTEAEWEYACRAGTTTQFSAGDGVESLREVGWCSYNGAWDGSGGTRPVGELRPNAFGLYDMHGNVWEWCADWYAADYYATAPDVGPAGPKGGTERVVRGGSWRGGPWFCRSAERRAISPDSREINVGVRVVVELG